VGVRSLAETRRIAIPQFEAIDYVYWHNNPDRNRMFFVKGLPPKGPRTHHVHIFEANNSTFSERLLFRDYLRKYSDEAQCYARLKRNLAQRFQCDREAYTTGKTEYVKSILEKAKASDSNWLGFN
jgi:GrpB-like predicted nucleotidyltransferase (UPF0157 family)